MNLKGQGSEDPVSAHQRTCVTREEFADFIVVRVIGDLDMATAAELHSALSPDSGRPIVVDLAETTFMDSSGLNALVGAHHSGSVVVLRNPSPVVRRAIDVSGLDQILTIE